MITYHAVYNNGNKRCGIEITSNYYLAVPLSPVSKSTVVASGIFTKATCQQPVAAR